MCPTATPSARKPWRADHPPTASAANSPTARPPLLNLDESASGTEKMEPGRLRSRGRRQGSQPCEGADSSEDAVSECFNGIAEGDLSRMWAIIDVDLKTGVSRSAWDACIAAQFPVVSYGSIVYEEAEVYTEDRHAVAVVRPLFTRRARPSKPRLVRRTP